uniref:Uncharacterized protein n=1 Tax=Ochrobactrum phage ORM_20 TaxID=2985243 RepID=A0A9N6WS32_9VIRU|nr:hypothetical protein ORM20_00102 [Ochrobactrum phage ORM_20]
MSIAKNVFEIFISTGEKNGFFTLRTSRSSHSENFSFYREAYIKNLSTDFEKAYKLAFEYYERMKERLETPDFEVIFTGAEYDHIIQRRGKLSVRDTLAIDSIEAGIVPFGKHKGLKIEDLPDTYLLWLTDKIKEMEEKDDKGVFFAFASIASGIAMEKGLLEKRDAERAERLERDLLSNHFGEIGKRYEEEVEVEFATHQEFGDSKYQFRLGDDILFHNGSIRLRKGKVKIRFTVKFHCDTKTGVRKTYINRIKEI